MLDAEALRQKFCEAGLNIESVEVQPLLLNSRPDFLFHASIDGRAIKLVVELKERPHLAELRLSADRIKRHSGPGWIPMVAAHFLGPNRRELLKEMGVGYIDMAGNIYLRAPGIFIEREEKANPFGYQHNILNPYSDKASIILRILLEDPGRSWKIREIASHGNINPGWVSRLVDSMVERGLVAYNRQSGISLLNSEAVLKEWADFYDWHKNIFHYYYCHAYDPQELLDEISKLNNDGTRFVLGFQAGAYMVSPYSTFNQVHLLIEGSSFDIIKGEIEHQLELKQKRDGANLILVQPYYRHSALFQARKIDKWWVASDIQLYLDLNRYPLRGHEQAEHLLQKVIRPNLNKLTKRKHGSK